MQTVKAKWWRFNRYQVVGDCILPSAGAQLEEYDVWKNYQIIRDSSTVKAPYESLVELLDEIFVEKLRGFSVTHGYEQRLEQWCSAHGLLGVLIHRTEMVMLAPRWVALTDKMMAPLQTRYSRSVDDWAQSPSMRELRVSQRRFDYHNPEHSSKRISGKLKGMMPKQHGKVGTAVRGGSPTYRTTGQVVARDIDGTIRTESLSENWARFFPCVSPDERETFNYPRPLTPDFWRQYGEPVYDFLEAADELRQGLRMIASAEHRATGVEALNGLLQGSTVRLQLCGEQLEQHWVGPSLLSALAMMALADLAGGKRLAYCPGCGRLFASRKSNQTYCRNTCASLIQKRRQRAKAK